MDRPNRINSGYLEFIKKINLMKEYEWNSGAVFAFSYSGTTDRLITLNYENLITTPYNSKSICEKIKFRGYILKINLTSTSNINSGFLEDLKEIDSFFSSKLFTMKLDKKYRNYEYVPLLREYKNNIYCDIRIPHSCIIEYDGDHIMNNKIFLEEIYNISLCTKISPMVDRSIHFNTKTNKYYTCLISYYMTVLSISKSSIPRLPYSPNITIPESKKIYKEYVNNIESEICMDVGVIDLN